MTINESKSSDSAQIALKINKRINYTKIASIINQHLRIQYDLASKAKRIQFKTWDTFKDPHFPSKTENKMTKYIMFLPCFRNPCGTPLPWLFRIEEKKGTTGTTRLAQEAAVIKT